MGNTCAEHLDLLDSMAKRHISIAKRHISGGIRPMPSTKKPISIRRRLQQALGARESPSRKAKTLATLKCGEYVFAQTQNFDGAPTIVC